MTADVTAEIVDSESSPAIIQQSELIGRLVIDRNTAEDLGRVEQLWLDFKTHQVLGLSCRSGLLGRKRTAFNWAQLETIGDEGIIVSFTEGAEVDVPVSADSPIGHEVWTDGGNRAGSIVDYRINRETGDVVDYLFVSNGWRGITDGIYRLLPNQVISIGTKRMMVQRAAAEEPEQVTKGLAEKVNKVADFLKEDYARTRQDMQGALEGTQAIATQLQATGQKVVGQAKETLVEVSDKLPAGLLSKPGASGTEPVPPTAATGENATPAGDIPPATDESAQEGDRSEAPHAETATDPDPTRT